MGMPRWIVLGTWLGLSWLAGLAAGEVRVDCDFPGGNVVVDQIAGDVVPRAAGPARPIRRPGSFIWYFGGIGGGGRTLQVEFTDGQPVGMRGPAVSTDGGRAWRWQGADHGTSRSFSYRFAAEDDEVRFAYTVPYLQADWERFLAAHQGNRLLRPGVLCRSRHDRPVECAYIGDPPRQGDSTPTSTPGDPPNSAPQHRILLTARHHACETMASFALEGLLQTVLAGDTEEGRWLAEHAELLVVPFVDKDGVEAGDPGRIAGRAITIETTAARAYRETAALRELAPRWSDGKLHVALDLHCPSIRGKHNEEESTLSVRRTRASGRNNSNSAGSWRRCSGGRCPTAPQTTCRSVSRGTKAATLRKACPSRSGPAACRRSGWPPSLELPYANAHGAEVTADSAPHFRKGPGLCPESLPGRCGEVRRLVGVH